MHIWLLTFESIYTKKVGGLAEVPPRLAEVLLNRGYNVWILTPGHGVECREESRIIYRTRLGDRDYFIEECLYKVPHLLIRGGLLDEQVVYPREKLVEKSLLFGAIVSSYYKFLASIGKQPSVVHGNDWHSVPALIGINALSIIYGVVTKFVYQIHLLSSTIIDMDSFEKYMNIYSDTLIYGSRGVLSFKEYYDLSRGFIDKLGAYLSNKVITVSKGFVKSILRNIDLENSYKVDYVHNALTWDWNSVANSVEKLFKVNPGENSSRDYVRKYLLTNYLSRIKYSLEDTYLEKYVENTAEKYSINYTEPFSSDGFFVFTSGRVSRQKGFDLLVKAMDRIVSEIPNIRIVAAIIPLHGSGDLFEKLIEATILYKEHFRIIPGYVEQNYYRSLFYASNIYLAPSRYEPFGLTVVEALASGTPVLASRTGGLIDIVIDIRENPEKGTGLLFKPGSIDELVIGLKYIYDLVNNSSDKSLMYRLRRNCIERSRAFDWNNSVEKLIKIYSSL